jgi:hypothetical protein
VLLLAPVVAGTAAWLRRTEHTGAFR